MTKRTFVGLLFLSTSVVTGLYMFGILDIKIINDFQSPNIAQKTVSFVDQNDVVVDIKWSARDKDENEVSFTTDDAKIVYGIIYSDLQRYVSKRTFDDADHNDIAITVATRVCEMLKNVFPDKNISSLCVEIGMHVVDSQNISDISRI